MSIYGVEGPGLEHVVRFEKKGKIPAQVITSWRKSHTN